MFCSVEGQSLRLEFNFRMDPEAAKISLSELKCPLQLLTWETCGEAPLEWVSTPLHYIQKHEIVKYLEYNYFILMIYKRFIMLV